MDSLRNGYELWFKPIIAIRDVTSIENMLTVFAIFFTLVYFSHSHSHLEA